MFWKRGGRAGVDEGCWKPFVNLPLGSGLGSMALQAIPEFKGSVDGQRLPSPDFGLFSTWCVFLICSFYFGNCRADFFFNLVKES